MQSSQARIARDEKQEPRYREQVRSDPRKDSSPLLRNSTLLILRMLKINLEGALKETNDLRIKTVKTPVDSIEEILSK